MDAISLEHNGKSEPGKRLAYSVNETSDLLGVAPITVYRLLSRGKLKAVRDLRTPLIPVSEIERFLKGAK